jgi:uncharacterized membrane protein YecN with MAPEG domain
MKVDNLVVIVTLAALLMYVWTGMRVGAARGKYGIDAPAVSGHPEFERTFRVQMNTLEWLPIFLPSLWLFAHYWDARVAAAVGVLWIIGRLNYAVTYVKDPSKRSAGFLVQALSTAVLLFGALGRAVYLLAAGS